MTIAQKIRERTIREFYETGDYRKKNVIDDILTERPFEFPSWWEKAFLEAMRCGLGHHRANSRFYGRLCAYKNFTEENLRSFEDIWDIPYILCDIFKYYDIDTKTPDLLKVNFSSTGTSGRRSKVVLDKLSGHRLLYSSYHIYKSLGAVSNGPPVNYLAMSYNPAADDTASTTNSGIVISNFAPQKNIFYALDTDRGEKIKFLKDEAVAKLKEFVDEGLPIRILGFLHHTCETIMAYRERYGKLNFPKNSYILSGGGWKSFAGGYGENFDLYKFLENNTNLDLKNMRDLYSLSEHPVFYFECEHHNMHIPNVALACTRDPRTLKKLKSGETGLVHLYTPLIESSPLLSILTTDYGCIKESCTCPVGGPYIKILGRAGVTKKGTCTLTADQYITQD